jgi:hypothetical protein
MMTNLAFGFNQSNIGNFFNSVATVALKETKSAVKVAILDRHESNEKFDSPFTKSFIA